MNEEEKKAIETVKQYKKCFIFETVHEETGERLNDYSNAIDIVIKLINKQQEEIKELSEKLTEKICKGVEEEILEEYRQTIISKDKEIEELKDKNKTLESLLQGNLYEMYLCYKEIANDYQANCISKDKIKTKIKEYEKLDKEYAKQGNFETEISLLKELLEE